jgi:hypothetical protein
MQEAVQTLKYHVVAANPTKANRMISSPEGFHQIGRMHIAGYFTCNNIKGHQRMSFR